MVFLFGQGSFLLKKYTATELGVSYEVNAQYELRQEYAHVFWIPLFPTGKAYVKRYNGDKDLYRIDEEIELYIKENYRPRTPWYTFSGIILVALFLGWMAYLDHQDAQNALPKSPRPHEASLPYNVLKTYPDIPITQN